jgi:hypothetical protein
MPDPTNDAPILQPTTTPAQPVAPDVTPSTGAPVLNDVVTPVTGPVQTAPPTPQGVAPGAPIPKQSFMEGANRGWNGRQYKQDSQGNIVSADPVRAPNPGGILGSLFFGALRGVSEGLASQPPEGAKGRGAGFSAAASAAEKGSQAQDERNRQIAQRNAENQRAATEAKLRANLMAAQTHDLVQKSQFDVENHAAELHSRGITDQEHQIQIANGLDQRRQVQADLTQTLISHGITPHASVSQTPVDGKTMDQQAMAHIPAVVGGKSLPVQNGKVGPDNGADFFSYEDLNQPVTGNSNDPSTWIHVPYFDGTKDNAGNFVQKERVIKPDSKITYGDVARQFFAADNQLDQFMRKDASQMAVQQKKLEMKEANERILLTDQQLQNAKAESGIRALDAAAKKQDKTVQDAFEDSVSHNPNDLDGTQTAAYMQQNHPKEYARMKANAIMQKANEGTTQVTVDQEGNKTTTKSTTSPFLAAPTAAGTVNTQSPIYQQALAIARQNPDKIDASKFSPEMKAQLKKDLGVGSTANQPSPLSHATPDQIVVQSADGVEIMPDIETAKDFVGSHPGWQILGAGTKQSTETQFGVR